jgi:hypothetical protein
VVIAHSDIPLQNTPSECRVYLAILQTALADWSPPPAERVAEPSLDWPYLEHEVRVVFPAEYSATIARLLIGEN